MCMHEGVQREQEKLVHKGEMREVICIDTTKAVP